MLYVTDLPTSTLHTGLFLYCPECFTRGSATRGDYFWMPRDLPFVCDTCDEPLVLACASERVRMVAA